MLGFGSSEIADLEEIFRQICAVETEDGLEFNTESVKGAEIKEGEEYLGVRIKFISFLTNQSQQIDIGFGNVNSLPAETVDFPTSFNFAAPAGVSDK